MSAISRDGRAKDGRLLLVRHTAVADAWLRRCYGTTDVPLSRQGRATARALAQELAGWRPDLVFSSPLRRACVLAVRIARESRAPLRIDARLSERDFGAWERLPWDDIHAATGDAMMGMLTAPDSFRPGGGETTNELDERVLAWYRELPRGLDILAVCHGGPIAVLAGTARGLAPRDWAQAIPPPGGSVILPIVAMIGSVLSQERLHATAANPAARQAHRGRGHLTRSDDDGQSDNR